MFRAGFDRCKEWCRGFVLTICNELIKSFDSYRLFCKYFQLSTGKLVWQRMCWKTILFLIVINLSNDFFFALLIRLLKDHRSVIMRPFQGSDLHQPKHEKCEMAFQSEYAPTPTLTSVRVEDISSN